MNKTIINKDKIKYLIVPDYFDGVQHEIKKREGKNNIIILFNSLLMTLEGIKLGLFSIESLYILT